MQQYIHNILQEAIYNVARTSTSEMTTSLIYKKLQQTVSSCTRHAGVHGVMFPARDRVDILTRHGTYCVQFYYANNQITCAYFNPLKQRRVLYATV